jgi:hypothetical protein
MTTQAQTIDDSGLPVPVPVPAAGGGNLQELRRQANHLLAEAGNIITAALSQDSEAFLQANRQHGGQ